VLVTHELPSIFKIVSRCIMLDKESRSIIATGDPRELRDQNDDPRVRHFFHRTPDDSRQVARPSRYSRTSTVESVRGV
jgi:phospholipid/cholesterol/gamma-HCH transport system ATP-binding protein